MSRTDQLLECICEKMGLMIENQQRLEHRLAALERAVRQPENPAPVLPRKRKRKVRPPRQE